MGPHAMQGRPEDAGRVMDATDVLTRHCSVAGCDYAEIRGSREGDFVNSLFVCPNHAADPRVGPGLGFTYYERRDRKAEKI